jgi:hypothetical protein
MQKKTLWFKAKSYGWGWTPVTWQGWAVIGVYIGLLVLMMTRRDAVWQLPAVVLLTGALISISYLTGEKPEWRWGRKRKEDHV